MHHCSQKILRTSQQLLNSLYILSKYNKGNIIKIFNMNHFLLTTHSAALFQMGVFLWNWKRRKDMPSVFMFIKFIYGVTFSLLYHSHHSYQKIRFLPQIMIMIIGLFGWLCV